MDYTLETGYKKTIRTKKYDPKNFAELQILTFLLKR